MLAEYRNCWPVRDLLQTRLQNSAKSYKKKQRLLEAQAQIAALEEETSALKRVVKGKGKGKGKAAEVEVGNKVATASGSGAGAGANKKNRE